MKISALINSAYKRYVLIALILFMDCAVMGQTIMFDDFTYTGATDAQLPVFNKWSIITGVSGPPEGGQYNQSNIAFIIDPNNSANKLMTLSTTVNGATKATTHSRIESDYEYFQGTYAARVYLTDQAFTTKDANIQTFFTIVPSTYANDGSQYSELDIVEYMAADKWGISPDNQVLYTTSYHKYIADPWQAWKTYFASQQSWAGWHTFIASCTDGINIKYWIDNTYLGAQSVTDNENQAGLTVYPRRNMQIAFANWIWNNVTGSSTANRTNTMQVDWVLFYQNQEQSLTQINTLVNGYRTQGLQRRNLAGQTYITNGCTLPAQPAAITGNATVASGSSQTYSVAAVSGATSYTWTLPSGWSGTSATNAITATAGTTSGTISVKANNACGAGTARTLAVTVTACTVPAQPAAITGNATVTSGSSQTYSVTAVSGATSYTWTLPSGWSGTSATNSITATAGTTSGNISAKANNACGTGTARTLAVTVTAGGTFTQRIEAENYSSMSGVVKETCSEGGQDVTSFGASDWTSYSVTIPATGTYKITLRVACTTANKTFRVEKDDGSTLLATITVPNTSGAQTWATTTGVNVTLPAGTYEIGLTTYTGGPKINWLEISNNLAAKQASSVTAVNKKNIVLSLYPNPVENTLNIKEWTGYKGAQVKVTDMSGNSLISGILNNSIINVAALTPGTYILHIAKDGQLFTGKFIKK